MYWFILSGAILLAVILGWLRHRRAEREQAHAAARAVQALDDADNPLVVVAGAFWFPALGSYGRERESAAALLNAFERALPADARRLRGLVRDARRRIDEDGELEEGQAAALRALFGAIAERGGLDDELRATLDAGALDWRLALDDDEQDDSLGPEQHELITDLRQTLANGDSEEVVRRIDARIDGDGVQGVYRAALLDCRGRALLQLDRPEEAVSDFEAASRLAPNTDIDDIQVTTNDQ